MTPLTPTPWWKEAVVYQIYPSSFKDSTGNGLGDIQGIISKVDYLASLKIDAIWLSPIYKSPQVDMGYDISDYRAIHEPYGTIEDVETLIVELRKRGMKLLMDLVVNHTSNQHPWFLESRSSRSNPKRDWYIWRKGRTNPDGERMPPNNWESIFKGSAWTYDPATDEWYFHMFHEAQPCFNWEKDEVRKAIHDDIHFWLKKGLGGLRIDAINLISKPQDFADAPVTQPGFHQSCFELLKNRPKVHDWLHEMRKEVFDHYGDLIYVGECGGTNHVDEVRKYIMPERRELDLIFQFEMMELDYESSLGWFSKRDWRLSDIKRLTQKWQTILRPGWNTFTMENHDSGRFVNRFGRTTDPTRFPAVSKMFAFLNMTLGGTIFLHQGQELGAQNLTADIDLREYKDMATHADFEKTRKIRQLAAAAGVEVDMSDVMEQVRLKARDHGRVPMAWDESANAGFSSAKPWMTLNSDCKVANVAVQERDADSVLNVWRRLIQFRKQHSTELVHGVYETVDESHEQIFAYTRTSERAKFLVALNWSENQVNWTPPEASRNRECLLAVGQMQDGRDKVEMDAYACACWKI